MEPWSDICPFKKGKLFAALYHFFTDTEVNNCFTIYQTSGSVDSHLQVVRFFF